MNYVRIVLNNLRDILFIILLFRHLGVRSDVPSKKLLAVLVLMLLMLISVSELGSALVSAIGRTLLRSLTIYFFLRILRAAERLQALYYSFFINALIVVCHNIMFTELTWPLFYFEVTFVQIELVNQLICILIINVLAILFYAVMYLMLKTDITMRPRINQCLILAVITVIVTYLNWRMKALSISGGMEAAEFTVFCILLQLSLFFCLIFYENLNYNTHQTMLMEEQLSSAGRMLQQLEQQKRDEQKIRGLMHDFKNHLSTIRYYIETDGQAALRYIDELTGTKTTSFIAVNTGYELIDRLLTEKLSDADELSIRTDIRTDLHRLESLEPIDLCVIFGNLIDNAVEAQQHVEPDDRFIRIVSQYASGMQIISVENSYDGILSVRKALPQTTKDDRNRHGIGLKNVQQVVQKYGGQMTIRTDQEEKVFGVYLSIPL